MHKINVPLPAVGRPRTSLSRREHQIDFLVESVQTAFQAGRDVAVFSHNKALLEQEFGNLDHLLFYDKLLATKFPQSVDVVLSTMRFGHAATKRIKRGNNLAVVRVVQERELRDVFQFCVKRMQPARSSPTTQVEYFKKAVQPTTTPAIVTDDAHLVIPENHERSKQVDMQVPDAMVEINNRAAKLEMFFARLHAHAAERGGWIGKRFWVTIRNECEIGEDDKDADAPTLVARGVLESASGAGHRIAKYRFITQETKVKVVDKTTEFMQSNLAKKEALLAEKRRYQEDMKAIDEKLADIATLEEAWTVIQAAMPTELTNPH